MVVVPVIERELRAAARHPATYNLRVLGAAALLVVLGMFWIRDAGGPGAGARLFGDFHRTLFFGTWLLVPLLTADCISRERREGTLPLLFLTPLRARDIVQAKGLAHGIRSFTIWTAVLPLFVVCFLGGGVGWVDGLASALISFSSVCLALGAGLIASVTTSVWTRALGWAGCLGVLFLFGFFALLPLALMGAFPTLNGFPEPGFSMALDIPLAPPFWTSYGGLFGVLRGYALTAVFSALLLFLLISVTAWRLNRTWQENPASARVTWWQNKLFRPVVFRKQLRGWLRWELQHNPIGWLERRRWSGRLVVWSWFAIVSCLYSSLFSNFALYQRAFHTMQSIVAILLAGSMALTSAGSFRRERETGVLELLLVAPLRESQVILGRLRGLWSQFLPSIILLFAVWLYCAKFLSENSEVPTVITYAVSFATIPVVGLYFSLAKSNFIAAVVWTLLVQLVIPAAVLQIAKLDHADESRAGDFLLQISIQIAVAWFLGWRLLVLLKTRAFVKRLS